MSKSVRSTIDDIGKTYTLVALGSGSASVAIETPDDYIVNAIPIHIASTRYINVTATIKIFCLDSEPPVPRGRLLCLAIGKVGYCCEAYTEQQPLAHTPAGRPAY
ncbi:MAG: hypothetical protein ACR2PR_01305 [Pseudohongiellaceae bacterium]